MDATYTGDRPDHCETLVDINTRDTKVLLIHLSATMIENTSLLLLIMPCVHHSLISMNTVYLEKMQAENVQNVDDMIIVS